MFEMAKDLIYWVSVYLNFNTCLIINFIFSDSDWWFARHANPNYSNTKVEGYVPRNYVAKEDSLESYE